MCSSSRSSGFFRSEIFISKLRTPPLLSYVLRLLSCSPKRETLRFETTALNSHSHWCSCCCCCSLEKVAPSALNIFYLFKMRPTTEFFKFCSQNMRKKLICQQPERELNHIPQNARGHQKKFFSETWWKPNGRHRAQWAPSHVLLNNMYKF